MRIGWSEIECNIVEIDGLKAELAEIDENLVRHNLDYMDEGEQLARRKEIYEVLYPQTKQGMRNGQTAKTADTATLEVKSFSADTSSKTGMSERTIREKIQISKNLTQEVKTIIKENRITEENSLKLSRIKEPEKQKEVLTLWLQFKSAGKTIKLRFLVDMMHQESKSERPKPISLNPE